MDNSPPWSYTRVVRGRASLVQIVYPVQMVQQVRLITAHSRTSVLELDNVVTYLFVDRIYPLHNRLLNYCQKFNLWRSKFTVDANLYIYLLLV